MKFIPCFLFRKSFLVFICLLFAFSANVFFAQEKKKLYSFEQYAWPDKFTGYKELPDSLKKNDAVVLSEKLHITDEEISRRVTVKILNSDGVKVFQKLKFPENFDLTNCTNPNKQGRFKDRVRPFMFEYTIRFFGARIIKPKNKIIDIPVKYSQFQEMWLKNDGERIMAEAFEVSLENLQPGDILEYYYLASVDWCRAQDVIYPNGPYPKLNYTLNIETAGRLMGNNKDLQLIYNNNVDTANFRSRSNINASVKETQNEYYYPYLKSLNYPENIPVEAVLPSISVNHRYCHKSGWRSNSAYFNANYVSHGFAFPPQGNDNTIYIPSGYDYNWVLRQDTVITEIYENYDKYIRKYIAEIEEDKTDTSGNIFGRKLTESLNQLKFVTAESMRYSPEAQYSVISSEHLFKGRLVEEFLLKMYESFWSERKKFFYEGVIIDKRKGVVNLRHRNSSFLEKILIVVPEKKGLKFYMPRYNGIKYFPDELPFYLEATYCVLSPCFNCTGNAGKKILMTNTPVSKFIENARSETDTFKVNLDSLSIKVGLNVALKGQFSTLLRHFYNKEAIDSTVPEHYFKKCTDKPLSANAVIKQTESIHTFPYKQAFKCSEKIKLTRKDRVDLTNWFSFLWRAEDFKELPNHDFFIDFPYVDSYNFVFDFGKPVEIVNQPEFSKKLENEYFEINCSLNKEEQNTFKLSVLVKVKLSMVLQKDGAKVIEFAKMLGEINKLEMQIK